MFWDSPVVSGIAVGIPSFIIGFLVYRRSVKVDKISEQAGVASDKTAGIAQAFEGLRQHIAGLNAFIAILQADARIDKEDIKSLTAQRDALQKELNRMYRKYGDNGNGTTAPVAS